MSKQGARVSICQAFHWWTNAVCSTQTSALQVHVRPHAQVDVAAAAKHGLKVVRVPAYSPRSVAEHALALTFTLAR